jgi:hypothetical protein
MKKILTAIALVSVLSSCAPGAFSRNSGVPLGVGETWVLETTNRLTNANVKFEFRVSGVSQPAARSGTSNSYTLGPYVITYRNPVTNVEWFEQYSNARYMLFYTSRLNDVNTLTIDIDRAFSEKATSCDFRGWTYSDTAFSGTHFAIVTTSSGSASFSQVGTCLLTRKP